MDDALGQVDWPALTGMWTGLAVALLIFSTLLGDRWLARLGQHVLVGAALGYAAVVTWRSMVALPLVQTLVANPGDAAWNWLPIVLAALLAAAALERVFFQGEGGASPVGWRRVLRWSGLVPAALMASAAAAIVAIGVVQGTLAPQFWRAAQTGFDWTLPPADFLSGLLLLVITVAALLYFTIDPQRHLASQPQALQRFVRGWLWVGQRAAWLAAGVVFARLFVSRVSLLAAQFEFFRTVLASTGIWQALEAFWRNLAGG